jgi:hypothetical protein
MPILIEDDDAVPRQKYAPPKLLLDKQKKASRVLLALLMHSYKALSIARIYYTRFTDLVKGFSGIF